MRLEIIDVQEPKGEGVLIRVMGAGMCKTDVRLWRGEEPREGFRLPFVLGHENSGIVEGVGDQVEGFKEGDRVLVYAIWSDLRCRHCRVGKYMQCKRQSIPGQANYYGGYAEYMYVPSYRFLVKIGDLDPIEAAPLADAGLTSYSAVKKGLQYVYPGSLVIVYGIGGLASYAIQFLRHMAPHTKILAVSRSDEKLAWAEKLGAHATAKPGDLAKAVRSLSEEGASLLLDFVGNEESAEAIKFLEPGGAAILVGMEGKSYPIPVFETTVWQYMVVGSNYGTLNEMEEMIRIVREGGIRSSLEIIRLDEAETNKALTRLAEGRVIGRFVIAPWR